MTEEEAMAKRLKEIPCCPHCGYELEEKDEVTVTDWNLQRAGGLFEDGVLKCDGFWESTEIWRNEETIDCPECEETAQISEWGIKLEY